MIIESTARALLDLCILKIIAPEMNTAVDLASLVAGGTTMVKQGKGRCEIQESIPSYSLCSYYCYNGGIDQCVL